MIDPQLLLLWCLEHIKCDFCQVEGATRFPRFGLFLCASDAKLADNIFPAASD